LKKILFIHLTLFISLASAFYATGLIDKARLDTSDINTRNVPIFSYRERHVTDGGSIFYESFIYSAFESRRLEVIKDKNGISLTVQSGYQGYTWKWHHHRMLLIASILAVSFLIYARRCKTQNT